MSGGSMDYISYQLENQEGCFRGDKYEKVLEDALKDFAELLHAREWYLSCDTGEDDWNEARDKFLAKYTMPTGKWKVITDLAEWGTYNAVCSNCGEKYFFPKIFKGEYYRICPKCGSRMER